MNDAQSALPPPGVATAGGSWVARTFAVGRGALYLGLASLAFMRPQLRIGGLAIVPTDAIMVVAGSCWLAASALGHRRPRPTRFHALLLLYFLAMLASALFAGPPVERFAVRLASEAYLLGLPVLVAGLLAEERHLRRAVLAWLAGTALIVAVATAALATALVDPASPLLAPVQHHLGSLPLGPFVRYRLTYQNPNMLGAYLTVSLMAALLAAERGWVGRPASMILISGIAMATLATFSAAIGGSILAGAIWYAIACQGASDGRRRAVLFAGSAVAIAFVVAQALTPVAYPHPLFALPVAGTGITLFPASRMQVWIEAARTFAAHPITGVGVGMDVAHVRFVEPGGAHVVLREAHNVLLNVAAGSGLLGAVAIAAILIAIWRGTHSATGRAPPDLASAAFGVGILDVAVYQGIGGSFEDARFVWAMVGLWLASSASARARHSA